MCDNLIKSNDPPININKWKEGLRKEIQPPKGRKLNGRYRCAVPILESEGSPEERTARGVLGSSTDIGSLTERDPWVVFMNEKVCVECNTRISRK